MESSPRPWAAFYSAMLVAVSIALLSKLMFRRRRCSRKLNLPPRPRPWPIIGNLHQIGSLPHRSLHNLSKNYGPLMQLRFGSLPVVVASSPDMAKLFLKTHDLNFASRPKTAAGKYTTYGYSGIVWSPYGPYWRQARKIFFKEIFSARRLELFEHIRVEEAQALVAGIFASLGGGGGTVNLKHHLTAANMNMISRMVLGKIYLDYNSQSNSPLIISPEEFKEMLEELFLLNGVLNIGDLIPSIDFLDLQGYVGRMKAVSKKFDRFLEHVLDEHDERRRRVENYAEKDMVDVLLRLAEDPNLEVKLTRDGVKALTEDLIAGGTESAAVTVEWAMSEIIRRPKIFERATEELDRIVGKERWVEEKDTPQLPYIEAIAKETMRMHPVATLLAPHFYRADCKISGYDIPAGTEVLINVWSIGRDANAWESPEEFRPERFLGKAIDVKGRDYELLPFGSGRRMCPGYGLGIKLVYATLAKLLQGFAWRLPEGKELCMEKVFGLSTTRKVPLELVAEPRLPVHLYQF